MKPSHQHPVIVIGASAGGVEALRQIAGRLPGSLPSPLFVVLHLSRESPSLLPDLLNRAGPLPAAHAADGEPIRPGRIYVAPPDRHLLLQAGRIHLRRGPRENNTRPAIDPLFRSAAIAYGPAAVGVVLTGNLYDGTAGLAAIKTHGGVAVVQDPNDATFPSMPESALREVAVDHCLPLHEIPALLIQPAQGTMPMNAMTRSDSDSIEVKIAEGGDNSRELLEKIAAPSSYSCPECGGTLWEIKDAQLLRFRCQVGHAYTADALLSLQDNEIEMALWTAVRALEERATLSGRMAERVDQEHLSALEAHFRKRQRDSEHHIRVLRRVLRSGVDEDPSE